MRVVDTKKGLKDEEEMEEKKIEKDKEVAKVKWGQ